MLLDTLHFSNHGIEVRHRLRPLSIEPTTKVTPTIHVHQYSARPPRLGPEHAKAVEKALHAAVRHSTSGWIQLDLEALDSQQDFYVALVKDLRASLPNNIRLSVTVRAGWCDRPLLLNSLAADEVVPMFFHMGDGAGDYRERLVARPESLAARCRQQAL